MLKRYTKDPIGAVFSDGAKYERWLKVGLAIIAVRVSLGKLTQAACDAIHRAARARPVLPERVSALERDYDHDVISCTEAIKEIMREAKLAEELVGLYNNEITSCDITESAYSLALQEAGHLILGAVDCLEEALEARAYEHQDTRMMGLTHTVLAEPITLGVKIINWLNGLRLAKEDLRYGLELARVGRLAGAVGINSHLDPEAEDLLCEALGLKPVGISTQIIHRSYFYQLFQRMEALANAMDHICLNLRNLCRFPRSEAQEPFKQKQRGSSQMPHKANPKTLEQLQGLIRVIRGMLSSLSNSVATDDEREISQSSVERTAGVDLATLVYYVAVRLTEIVRGMVFFPEQMQYNLDLAGGLWGSGALKDAILQHGQVADLPYGDRGHKLPVYDWIKELAIEARRTRKPFQQLVKEKLDLSWFPPSQREALHKEIKERVFNLDYQLRNTGVYFKRWEERKRAA